MCYILDHSKGLFYSFEDKHNAMVHGKNETWSVMKKTPTVYTGPENDHTFKSGMLSEVTFSESFYDFHQFK